MSQSCLRSNLSYAYADGVIPETFIRKMNGGSQSCLVGASDGRFYILKFSNNPQGPNVLFNEALGAMLLQHLGLPTPQWSPIRVTSNFVKSNPGVYFESDHGTYLPSPGVHFGSRFVTGSASDEVYEIVPHLWMERIRNPEFFVGMLLLDIWVQHVDRRQALLVEGRDSDALDVVFFDHGHMFGGPLGNKTVKNAHGCLYYHRNVYRRALGARSLEIWLDRIEGVNEIILSTMVDRIPREWRSEAAVNRTISLLMRNQRTIRQRVREVAGVFHC